MVVSDPAARKGQRRRSKGTKADRQRIVAELLATADSRPTPSPEEVWAASTSEVGTWTDITLAGWGVNKRYNKGWRHRLENKWRAENGLEPKATTPQTKDDHRRRYYERQGWSTEKLVSSRPLASPVRTTTERKQ